MNAVLACPAAFPSAPNFDPLVAAGWAKDWLFNCAFPMWSTTGFDRPNGDFFEAIDLAGRPVLKPKRVRVQARQVIAFAAAGRWGWDGPWLHMVNAGLKTIRQGYKRVDGLYAITPDHVGMPRIRAIDLYDQAFVVLALAAGWNATGRPAVLLAEAEALVEVLNLELRHPIAGFYEAGSGDTLLRSNPHMHMLEASLAWLQLGVGGIFERLALDLVELARCRLSEPANGSIGEYYNQDWSEVASGELAVREPGHQFEWAYLLRLGTALLGEDSTWAAERLESFGSRYGILKNRIVFATDPMGGITDASSRLWAQTEALRCYLVSPFLRHHGDGAVAERMANVADFLDASLVPGLWRERATAKGRWVVEDVPASSLYHIVTGLAPLFGENSKSIWLPV